MLIAMSITTAIAVFIIVWTGIKRLILYLVTRKYAKQYIEEAKNYIDYDQPFKLIKMDK